MAGDRRNPLSAANEVVVMTPPDEAPAPADEEYADDDPTPMLDRLSRRVFFATPGCERWKVGKDEWHLLDSTEIKQSCEHIVREVLRELARATDAMIDAGERTGARRGSTVKVWGAIIRAIKDEGA